MNNTTESQSKTPGRRIIGISLSPEMACEVKAEAGRRGISLRKMFEELWELYKQQPRKEP
jgi:hypothetical protein